jgi:GntR family transcriptional regulator
MLPVRASTPTYQRISQTLRRRILDGRYPVDSQIPTEDDLLREFSVSRHTVRAALQQLVAEGLVRRHAGRGSFVQQAESTRSLWGAQSLEDMVDRNFGEIIEDDASRLLEPGSSEEHAARQHLATNDQVIRYIWTRCGDEGPNAVSEVDLPRALADRVPADWRQQLRTTRLLRLVEQYCHVRAERVRQIASAVGATPAIARKLRIKPGAPLLCLERTYFDHQGEAIEHSLIQARADRCTQVVEMFRRN